MLNIRSSRISRRIVWQIPTFRTNYPEDEDKRFLHHMQENNKFDLPPRSRENLKSRMMNYIKLRLKSTNLWDVTPCSLVVYQCFWGICSSTFTVSSKQDNCCLLSCLAYIYFGIPWKWGSASRNVGKLLISQKTITFKFTTVTTSNLLHWIKLTRLHHT
jgi:hypothetical protein